jgi:hypothetical protein
MPHEHEQLHPYVGYTYVPSRRSSCGFINPLGFRGPLPSKSNEVLNVLVLGGSVASALAQRASTGLQLDLAGCWGLEPKRINVVNGALGGYRQPQSLFVLIYLCALGYDFTSVVLLDGFNEIALYPSEDIWAATDPCLPRNWVGRIHASLASQIARRIEDQVSDQFGNTGGYSSHRTIRNRFGQSIAKWLRNLTLRSRKRKEIIASLPKTSFSSRDDMFANLGEQWARGSELTSSFCAARKIQFTHFLQPNQYLRAPDHAIPSNVYQLEHPYRAGVVEGYPHLQARGESLKARGVAFHDLSSSLDQMPMLEAYIDACCHLSEEANAYLSNRIASAIPKPNDTEKSCIQFYV